MSNRSIVTACLLTIIGVPAWVWLMKVAFGQQGVRATMLTLLLVSVVGWVYIVVTEVRNARKHRPQRKGAKHRA